MMQGRHTRIDAAFQIGLAAVILTCVVAGILANQWLATNVRHFITDEFNQGQLLIARNAGDLIEREIELLKKEVMLVAGEIPESGFDLDSHGPLLMRSLSRVQENGVHTIEIVDFSARTAISCKHYARTIIRHSFEESLYAYIDPRVLDRNTVRVSLPRLEKPTLCLTLAIALDGEAKRALLYEVNLPWLLTPFLKNVRSGETGYAWIIDSSGKFLYHPDPAFIGEDAFLIRQVENPGVSYEQINSIQREYMLRGREGVGSYLSGRHRGLTGNIEKLIAYTPVSISENPDEAWSVAVVAPMYELADILKKSHRAQLLLLILVIVLVTSAGVVIILRERKWSLTLERQVDDRTEELRRSEEKYRSLVESSEDYIFTLGKDYRIQSLNSFTAKFLGDRPDNLMGRKYDELLPDDVAGKQLFLVRRVLEGGKSVRSEFEIRRPESGVWINASYMPLKDDRNQVGKVLCIARDVTEQKKLEHSLLNAEKLASLGTLAAGFAHEINNPLGVIQGFCDLLLRRAKKGSQEHEDLTIIERQGQHCKRIVDNLMTFARVEEETHEFTDINRCINDIVQVVRHGLEMKGSELVLKLDNDIPPVRGDPRQLQQVFVNLINNAVAAMPGGGSLQIETFFDRAARRTVATVRDTGCGIDPEALEHIFEPFFTTKPAGEGTGLGLFVSYGIINKYGGRLDCKSRQSESPETTGQTTFTIELPIEMEGLT